MALDELPPLSNLTGCGKTLFSRRSTQINADKTFVLNPRLSAFIRGQPFDGLFQHPVKEAGPTARTSRVQPLGLTAN